MWRLPPALSVLPWMASICRGFDARKLPGDEARVSTPHHRLAESGDGRFLRQRAENDVREAVEKNERGVVSALYKSARTSPNLEHDSSANPDECAVSVRIGTYATAARHAVFFAELIDLI